MACGLGFDGWLAYFLGFVGSLKKIIAGCFDLKNFTAYGLGSYSLQFDVGCSAACLFNFDFFRWNWKHVNFCSF